MEDKELFNTDEKKSAAVAAFRQLKKTEGWRLLLQVARANVDALEEQILSRPEGLSGDEMDRKRDKRLAYKEIINIPDHLINLLEEPRKGTVEEDPYHTVESLKENRQESTHDVE